MTRKSARILDLEKRMAELNARVVSDPDIRGGVLVLSGTRIPAKVVAGLLRDGLSGRAIRDLYPSVTAAHLRAVQEWADRAHCEGHGGYAGVWYCCEHPKAGWPCPEIGSGHHE